MAEDAADEGEIADLRDTRATHLRIMARVQGRRDGWFEVLKEIRKQAADAFGRDDDAAANRLRDLARSLKRHPYLDALDAEEKNSMERVDAANARLSEITSED